MGKTMLLVNRWNNCNRIRQPGDIMKNQLLIVLEQILKELRALRRDLKK